VVEQRWWGGVISAGSILVADCGSTRTTVALIEQVNGHHRLVARGEALSTHQPPWLDLIIGVREAIRQIETLVGRRLLTQAGALIKPQTPTGDGVDTFVAVSSAGMPMRVVLAGLTGDVSLASARRAVAGTYALINGTLALDEGARHRDPNARMQVLRQAKPDVVLITGGTDGGATRPVMDLAQLVALYNQVLASEERPLTFYAGNAHLADEVVSLFAAVASAGRLAATAGHPAGELRVVGNVRPGLEVENLGPAQKELGSFYQNRRLARVPGFDTLNEWADRPVLPTARSFGQVIRYIGDRYQLKVAGIDLGSASTLLAARVGDLFSLTTCANLGIGLNIRGALAQVLVEHVIRWLPLEMDPDDARDALLNKSLHPASVPQTWEELLLEYALAREVMRRVVAQARPGWLPGGPQWPRDGHHHPAGTSVLAHTPQWDLIIGAGRTLTRTPQPGYAALLLLDALEPVGVSKMALDAGGVAAMLGAMAGVHPLAAAEVVEYDAFLNLGTVVAPLGTARPGDVAIRVKVHYSDGRVIEEEVAYGSIDVIPLELGERAALELHPTRRFDVGLGEPGRGATAEAEGGILGIVVDGRGRPLELPADDEDRRQMIQEWMSGMGLALSEGDLESELIGWLYEG
jgi:hypothetical protein